jgi:hypothetical protein
MYGTGAGSTTVAEVCRTTPPQAVRAFARLLAIAGVLACVVPVASNSPATGRIVGRVRLVAVNSSRPMAIAYSSRALLPQGQAPREITERRHLPAGHAADARAAEALRAAPGR